MADHLTVAEIRELADITDALNGITENSDWFLRGTFYNGDVAVEVSFDPDTDAHVLSALGTVVE